MNALIAIVILAGVPIALAVGLIAAVNSFHGKNRDSSPPRSQSSSSELTPAEKRSNWLAIAYWIAIAFIIGIGISKIGFHWDAATWEKLAIAIVAIGYGCFFLYVASALSGRNKMGSQILQVEPSQQEKDRSRSYIIGQLFMALFYLAISLLGSKQLPGLVYSLAFWFNILISLWKGRAPVYFTEGGIYYWIFWTPWKQVDRYVWREDKVTIVISRLFPWFSTEQVFDVPPQDKPTVDRLLADRVRLP